MMAREGAANNQPAAKANVVSYIAPMRVGVRTFVIWLLVLALPAQGAAAATMALCNPNLHGTVGTAPAHDHGPAQAAGPAPRHVHEHPAVHPAAVHEHRHPAQGRHDERHHHADRATAHAEAGAAATSGDTPAQKLAQADLHNCSACAACCSAAAFSSAVVKVPSPQFEPTVFSSLVPSVQRFASSGPDRPPRSLVA